MNKESLFQSLKSEVEMQLKLAVEAVQNSLSAATHEESKPENKYDTRGLEASYLARAQSERVLDLKALNTVVSGLRMRNFSSQDPIAISALIHLESSEKKQWILLLPKGGGQSFMFEDTLIKVITPDSPLGARLVGKMVDDTIEFKNTEYLVLAII